MSHLREASPTLAPIAQPRAAWWQRGLLLGPAANQEARNIRAGYLEIACSGLATGIAINFMSVFAVRLGASDLVVGAVNSGPYLASLLWSLPTARLINDKRRLMPIMIASLFLYRLTYLLIALVPSLLSRAQAEAIAVISFLGGFPMVMVNIAVFTMLAEAIAPEHLARVVSRRVAIGGFTSIIALLLTGLWLERSPFPLNYQVAYSVAFLISIGSVWYMSRIKLLGRGAPAGAGRVLSWREQWQNLRRNRVFFLFLISATFLHLSLNMSSPLYPILVVNKLGASDGWVSILLTLFTLTSVVGAWRMDWVIRRWGTRRTLAATMIGLGVYTTLLAIAPSIAFLVPVHFFGGFLSAGFNVGLANGLLEFSPEENRGDFVAAYMLAMNIAIFVGPLLGSMLSTLLGLVPALLVVAAMRTASGFVFQRLRY
jgi:MFS family permease